MVARSCCAAIFGALIGALSAMPSHAVETVNVVTPSRVIFSLPYWIAERKGYFKDEGLDAKLEIVPDGRKISEQLRSGAAHFSLIGPDAAIIDGHGGGPLRVVAGTVRRPPLFLITKPAIKTFADLRGAKIGVLSLTEGSSKLLIKMAKANGVAASDLKITAVGGAPARWTLLKEGKIDAGLQPLPLNYEAEVAGFNDLGWAGKYEPDWQFNTINANSEWTRRNPELATKFARAMLRGQQLIWSNPDEAAQIASTELKTPLPLAARSLSEAVRLEILDRRLEWSETGLARIFENMLADGVFPAERKFELSKAIDATYLRAAQSSLRIK